MNEEIKFSSEAQMLLDQMPNFDPEDFKQWWFAQGRQVGSRNLMEYLMFKDLGKRHIEGGTKIVRQRPERAAE